MNNNEYKTYIIYECPKLFWEKGFELVLQGGFPIEIETQISKLITYSLVIFIL